MFRYDQIIEPSGFMEQYQRWRDLDGDYTFLSIEFTILVMRICAYTSLLLPSASYTLDSVRGTKLADIRSICKRIGRNLSIVANEVDGRSSLIRIQQQLFSGLQFYCEGEPHELLGTLRQAAQMAKDLGLYPEFRNVLFDGEHVRREEELGYRAVCILYIWDK
jgi:hypothetical protein